VSSPNDAVNASVAPCERRVSHVEQGRPERISAPQREHRMDSADWNGIAGDHSTDLPIIGSYNP
jgi:hypothetical protein